MAALTPRASALIRSSLRTKTSPSTSIKTRAASGISENQIAKLPGWPKPEKHNGVWYLSPAEADKYQGAHLGDGTIIKAGASFVAGALVLGMSSGLVLSHLGGGEKK